MTTEQPTPVLDDLARLQVVDTRNMLRLINELPEQCETALGIGRSFTPGEAIEPPNLVFLTGTGDSGTAADMAAVAVGEYVNIPVISDRGGPLPKYVSENALVVILDYTGNNQSALRVYREARMRGCGIICVTSGGKLRETAVSDETRIIRIPPGQPARTAIGYLFVPAVALFEQLGLAQGVIEKLSYGIRLMKNAREALRFENATARNTAKQIALALDGRHVLVYGARDYRSAVACRWRSQISANAKTPACVGFFPDMAEGSVSAWETSGREACNTAFVLLKDAQDRTEVKDLMAAAESVLEGFQIVSADMKGSTNIEKLLYGTYLADYVSFYMALAAEVNPTPLDFVKRMEDWFTVVEEPVAETQEENPA